MKRLPRHLSLALAVSASTCTFSLAALAPVFRVEHTGSEVVALKVTESIHVSSTAIVVTLEKGCKGLAEVRLF